MPIVLHRDGVRQARRLIERGMVDRTSSWDWTTELQDRILGDPPDWERYGRWHLGREPEGDPETKAYWRFPYGDGERVVLAALRAAITRAAQNGHADIERAARELLQAAKGENAENSMRVVAFADHHELLVYGDIGDAVDARSIAEEVASIDSRRPITVRISSYGGSLADGIAIYQQLSRRDTTVVIEGVAASAASIIAMAGRRIEMAADATLMIHGPHVLVHGGSSQLRDMADGLDRLAESMAQIYARRPKVSLDQARSWVFDGRDHWFSAAEALELGLVDAVVEAHAAAAAAISRAKEWAMAKLKRTAADVTDTAPDEENIETRRKEPEAARKVEQLVADADAADMAAPDAIEARVIVARQREIRAAFAPFRGDPDVERLYEQMMEDVTVPVAEARKRLLETLAGKSRPIASTPVDPDAASRAPVSARVTIDEREKVRKGMVAWIAAKAGVTGLLEAAGVSRDELDPGEFRGMSMVDMARDLLARAGIDTKGMPRDRVIATALGTPGKVLASGPYQTTSDFAVLLEDTLRKTLLGAYATQPVTYRRWARVGTVSDFRAHKRYRVALLGSLEKLVEGAQIPVKAIPDGEAESITADEYGMRAGLSRKALVNDDLGAFRDIAAQLGAAARRSEESAAVALLASNPTMSDGNALFHANHGNIGTASAPSVPSLSEARTLMARQRDPAGNDYLDLRPAVWLGPVGLDEDVRVIVESQYDPDAANKLQRPNKVRGLVSDIIGTPRLTGTAWYVFADPSIAPTIEIAFLEGQEQPQIEQTNPWETTGVEWKVTHAFGVAAIDWRGAVYNAGA